MFGSKYTPPPISIIDKSRGNAWKRYQATAVISYCVSKPPNVTGAKQDRRIAKQRSVCRGGARLKTCNLISPSKTAFEQKNKGRVSEWIRHALVQGKRPKQVQKREANLRKGRLGDTGCINQKAGT